jgi:hypothetical protein
MNTHRAHDGIRMLFRNLFQLRPQIPVGRLFFGTVPLSATCQPTLSLIERCLQGSVLIAKFGAAAWANGEGWQTAAFPGWFQTFQAANVAEKVFWFSQNSPNLYLPLPLICSMLFARNTQQEQTAQRSEQIIYNAPLYLFLEYVDHLDHQPPFSRGHATKNPPKQAAQPAHA